MPIAIKIESVSKLYRLGTVGTGTISHDLNRWWQGFLAKRNPASRLVR
jgi:lipopolysaccharide transport system ATP-binding protein